MQHSAYVIQSECFTGFYEANKLFFFLKFILNGHHGFIVALLSSHIKDWIVLFNLYIMIKFYCTVLLKSRYFSCSSSTLKLPIVLSSYNRFENNVDEYSCAWNSCIHVSHAYDSHYSQPVNINGKKKKKVYFPGSSSFMYGK